jgi:hypothetical protein
MVSGDLEGVADVADAARGDHGAEQVLRPW